jgi:hypothetical protein
MSVSVPSSVIALWSICELAFYASEVHNWDDFPLQVTFENGDAQITLDAYWDGGNVWKVRFAPTKTGTWKWRASSTDSKLDGLSGRIDCIEPEEDQIAENPNLRGHLRISPNGRYFTYADSTPFFYLGDTCWSMNEERCGVGENQDGPFYVWMKDRKSKGITVINHWIFKSEHPAVDGKTYPSSNEGGEPFEIRENEYVFDKLKPGFYRYVDVRWRALWENGFVMAGPPTWFCKPKHHANLEQAKNISRYIMSRYGVYNLVWALSGEYSFGEQREHAPWNEVSAWNELGTFIAEYNPYKHPISIHPGPANYHASSSIDFHNSGWLDHNWLQSGQYPRGQHRIALWARDNYDRKPVKPVLHAEGFYEGNNAADNFHIRYQPWSAFLNGACGDVYGAHAIWTFSDHDDPRSIRWGKGDRLDWREGLELPGSGHLKHVADFFNSIEWWKLVPHREWLRVDENPPPMPTEDDITPPHCAAERSKAYVIYIPQGNRDKAISVTHLEGKAYKARWYDPRNGIYSDINDGKPVNTDQKDEWTLPSVPDDEDWVVILTRIAVDESNTKEIASPVNVSETAGFNTEFTFPPKLSADGRYLE